MQSFYRRPLPTSLVPFSSAEGRAIFREALVDGTMEGYFPLAEQFHTQGEPAFCGLGALVVVLNALAIDPGRSWKGPWRWYSEELLDCCRPLEMVKREGLTMSQLRCLARCNGAEVESFSADRSTLGELREHVLTASRAADGPHLIAGYSRGALDQTGDGHFSPLGGYHRGRDLVLVLDVARFKYPPHWAPLSLLWEAMQPPDPVTGRPRGYLVLRRGEQPDTSICRLTSEPEAFRAVASELGAALPEAIAAEQPSTVEAVMEAFFAGVSPAVATLLTTRAEPASGEDAVEQRARLSAMMAEVRRAPLFEAVRCALEGRAWSETSAVQGFLTDQQHPFELATLLVLACPREIFTRLPPTLRARLEALRAPGELPPQVRSEVLQLAAQMTAMRESCCEPG
ncbi:MAG: phytochelatin synthase family protein [Byssovorax sp.]